MKVCFLGTGIMGGAMARNASIAGLEVAAWSVPLADAERLSTDGVVAHPTVAAAVAGAEIVVTLVPDATAIESFAEGPDGLLANLAEGAIWVQSSTVGVAPADRLIGLAGAAGVTIVDAPLLGSQLPAERGELVVLASGERAAIDRCEPYFETVSRRVVRLGPAGNGSRMKMVTNGWIMSCVGAVAEAMALAEALGVEGRGFLEAITDSALDMGYAQTKGRMMLRGEFPAQMRLANGAKDARLATEANRGAGLEGAMVGAAAAMMARGVELGHAEDDMAAAFFAAREPRAV